MFSQKKKNYYSTILGFKSPNDFDLFAKRYLGYLEQDDLTKNRIMSGFFILLEIQKETFKNKNMIVYDGIKNQHVKKYATEILDLRKQGNGSQSIVSYLFENHRVEVSRLPFLTPHLLKSIFFHNASQEAK